MKPSATDELIGAVMELRSLFPDWRLGQLVANLALAAGRDGDDAIWEVEDEQLLAAARRLIQRNCARLGPKTGSGVE
jgi:hypothetical protein